MPILFRAAGADSNPAGASSFVGIPVPVGACDGDVVVVAIAVTAGIVVTPPSGDWQSISVSDPVQFGLVAFWTTVLNAPANWVFALSRPTIAAGVAVVYASTDAFTPVEAFATASTPASATHNAPAVAASLAGEEYLVFMAAATSGTYAPAAGLQEIARKQQSAVTIEAQRRPLTSAGNVPAFTETFSSSAAGVSLAICIAPSYGTSTLDDVYDRLFTALPPGLDDFLDFTPTGDYYKLFRVVAQAMKVYAFDLVDLVRQEIVPYLSRFKLPDWERFFALQGTRVALRGTIPQRQAQVLSSWRRAFAKSANKAAIQAALQPLFGYFPTTPVEIREAERSALTTLHSYGTIYDKVLTPPSTTTVKIDTTGADGGVVSAAGAQLQLAFSDLPGTSAAFTLTAPSGVVYGAGSTSARFAAGKSGWSADARRTSLPIVLYAPEAAGEQIAGTWIVSIALASGSPITLYAGPILFVEGIAPNQDTGGAIFHWGAYADPTHVGENGTAANFSEALAAIKKFSHSHSVGRLLTSVRPWPSEPNGPHAAVPGRCVPTSRTD